MQKKLISPSTALIGLLILGLAVTLPLHAQVKPMVAESQLSGTVITWQPQIAYDQLELRVSGPAGDFSATFTEGQTPFFDLAALEGPVDGSYSFELVAVPQIQPEVRQQMLEARTSGDSEILERQLRTQGVLPSERLVQSGYFRVAGGQLVTPGATETPGAEQGLQPRTAGEGGVSAVGGESVRNISAADQVILDDLIVDGSACIGFDCVNGESFGFDTLRLKENNLRIKFQDTSSSASFPTNDWQLTANDSSNGGAEKFSIDDIDGGRTPFTIEASAPSNSLYVDDGGRVGMGTSTPVVQLHVKDGNTPTLRLEQDGSSGFTPQTWDVAGNETNFFIRDATNGSQLPLRIRPGADSNAIFIDNNNEVGLGTASPGGKLDVRDTGSTTVTIKMWNSGSSDSDHWEYNAVEAATDHFLINKIGSGVQEFRLNQGGDLTISGEITTSGSCSGGCDRVFSPSYQLESIEEHATAMWANSHLPAVGPTPETGPFNLSQKTGAMLNELEKAHIYIEQLHTRLKDRELEVEELKERLAKVEELLFTADN